MSATTVQVPPGPAAVPGVDPRTAQEWISRGQAVLIDVREPDEHAKESIPGSRLIPLSKWSFDQVRGLGGTRIVIHCAGGTRSAEAVRMLGPLSGFDAWSLSGGIKAWKQAGLLVESSAPGCHMSVMRQTQIAIGIGILGGAAASYFARPEWLLVPVFLGTGLLFAGITGTCGLAVLLSKMPWNRAGPKNCSPGSCC